MDVVDLREFYQTPLGQSARMLISRTLAPRIAVHAGQTVMGLGFAHPYLDLAMPQDAVSLSFMLARQGGVKLMDFGIARDKSFEDLTEAGTGIGTPAYMSPEQILGDKLDANEKAEVDAPLQKLKTALAGTDTEAIKAATEELTQAFYKISEKLYAQAGGAAGPEGAAGCGDPNCDGSCGTNGGAAKGSDGGQYYDADYSVVDDDDKKK